jgi:5S rRNA maturation endonuclease (ribonuclease M5)
MRSGHGHETPFESPDLRDETMTDLEATYPYFDEEGDLLYQQTRSKGKRFAFRRPLPGGGWAWNLEGVERVIYNLPEVIAATEVFIAEGEKDAETLKSLGLVASTNPGGAGKWQESFAQFFRQKKVYILPDDDEPGRKHAQDVAKSVSQYASEVRLIPAFRNAKDVSEWVERGGTKRQLLKLVAKTPRFETKDSDQASEGRATLIAGPNLVKKLELFFKRRVILPRGLALVLAVWVIGSHLFDLFDCFPYICISSPTKRCGKTLLAELIALTAARAKFTVNITEAALFRVIQSFQPTIVIDEAETLRNQRSERAQFLLSLLNAGHRRNGTVIRCVGPNHAPTEFQVFCPKVLLAIGSLPDTFRDRSIVILMRRRRKDEQIQRYRYREVSKRGKWRNALATAWAEAHRQQVAKRYDRVDLNFLTDREADNWAPLFAIASVAVPSRLEELKQIAIRLGRAKNALDKDDSDVIRLLTDLRNTFGASRLRRVSTEQLLSKLQRLPESQWGDLTAPRLAKMLKPFGVSSRQLWIGERNVHGYEIDDLEPVFEAYVEEAPLETLEDA